MIVINEKNWYQLLRPDILTEDRMPQIRRRLTRYGTPASERFGLSPLGDFPTKLISPSDYQSAIDEAHRTQRMPMYHEKATWRKVSPRWNQNGFPWCWAWGATGTCLSVRGMAKYPTVILAPNSIAWKVGWRKVGYFLDGTIDAIRQRGIASAEFVPNFLTDNPNSFKEGWEDDALKYRLIGEVYDCDNRSANIMEQHCISLLCAGIPIYAALDWWGHALQCCGIYLVNGLRRWVWSNSHNEDDLIIIEGSRGRPSEGYGFTSMSLVES